MDPVTHTLAGLAAASFSGQAFSLTNPVYLGAALGSLAPDLDILYQLKGEVVYLKNHRGMSHSLPGLIGFSGLIAFVLHLFFPTTSFSFIWWWTFLGAVSHSLLDLLNSHGLRLFWPLSNKLIALNLLNITDPIFLFILTGITFGSFISPELVRVSVMALIAYLLLRFVLTGIIHGYLRRKFHGEKIKKIVVMPALLSIWKWYFLVETETTCYTGEMGVFSWALTIYAKLEKHRENRIIKAAMESTIGRIFREFTPHFYVIYQQLGNNHVVRFLDLRYYLKKEFLHSATVVFNQHCELREQFFHPFSRSRKIKVTG
ncbi:membrane-bound metal-dependent hydrolase [Calderihabitans maritimus]|uniref:Membrane-bound metal-dependent hydrolase n=2 Tax=Calderihabitans maritimus TaxID=1246530 RepID=A0A1Z5HRA6_9FIRM|nr:membrane-bound metal-dependent hydrolase [Calderihabitans maritimus]